METTRPPSDVPPLAPAGATATIRRQTRSARWIVLGTTLLLVAACSSPGRSPNAAIAFDAGRRDGLVTPAVATAVIEAGQRELGLVPTIDLAVRRLVTSVLDPDPTSAELSPPMADEVATALARQHRRNLADRRLEVPSGDEPTWEVQAIHRHPGQPVLAVVCISFRRLVVRPVVGEAATGPLVVQQVLHLEPSPASPGWTVTGVSEAIQQDTTGAPCPPAPSEDELCGCEGHDGEPRPEQGGGTRRDHGTSGDRPA